MQQPEQPSPPHTQSQSANVTCLRCGYDLTSVAIGSQCPECGAPVNPSYQVSTSTQNSGKAVASLVLGICAIVGCMMYGLPSIICGPLAIFFYKQTKDDIIAGHANPNSLSIAKAGLITGIIGTALGALGLLGMIAWFVGMSIAFGF